MSSPVKSTEQAETTEQVKTSVTANSEQCCQWITLHPVKFLKLPKIITLQALQTSSKDFLTPHAPSVCRTSEVVVLWIVQTLSKCTPRIALLTEIRGALQLETPTAMLYTQGGSIPHVTREVFKMFLKDEPYLLQIPLVTTYYFLEAMSNFSGNLSDFIGMKDCVTCMTLQDPGNLTQSGHHFKDSVPIWTRSGKVLINSNTYMNAVESFKPDMYFLLSDGDTNISSPAKRVNKAVDRTLLFYRDCLERHKKSDVLKDSFVVASVSGGYCLKARERCITEMLKTEDVVKGFLIDGLHNNGPETEFITFEEIRPVVEFIIDKLPQGKLRVIHGCYNPVTVINLVKLGVDLFDTSYCHLATERSAALTFALEHSTGETEYEINLRQEKYADDFQPILLGCSCLTCCNYSRGYIHHLLTVQELLAPVLLSIHNIHHYLKFFDKLRECILSGKLQELEDRICHQFDSFIKKVPNKSEQAAPLLQIGDTY